MTPTKQIEIAKRATAGRSELRKNLRQLSVVATYSQLRNAVLLNQIWFDVFIVYTWRERCLMPFLLPPSHLLRSNSEYWVLGGNVCDINRAS